MDADLSIRLKSLGYNLDLNFNYSSTSDSTYIYGNGRSCSVNEYIISTIDGTGDLFVVKGDQSNYLYEGFVGGDPYDPVAGAYSSNEITSPNGILFYESFPNGGQAVYEWNTLGFDPVVANLTEVVSAQKVTMTLGYDGGVGFNNRLSTIKMADDRVVSLSYGAGGTYGLLQTIQDWGDRVWTRTYDGTQNLESCETPIGCTTRFTTVTSGDGIGQVASIEDSNGFITQYGYTANNQVATMVAGTGIWTWTYDRGNVSMNDPGGGTTEWFLTSAGQIDHIAYPVYTVSFVYDANGRMLQQIMPNGPIMSVTLNSYGLIETSDDLLGNRTTIQYSSAGDPTTVIDACGNVWSNIYDSYHNIVGTVDPLGRHNTFTYTSYGLLASSQDGRGLVTSNTWDSHGNLTEVQYSDGGVVTMSYDVWNRMVSRTDQIGRTVTNTWDLADNLIAQTNALGETTSYVYSNCLLIADISALGHRNTYTYDRFNNRVTTENALGNVWTNLYDNMGFPVGTVDPAGNQTTIVYNSAHQKIADVDQLGNHTSVVSRKSCDID